MSRLLILYKLTKQFDVGSSALKSHTTADCRSDRQDYNEDGAQVNGLSGESLSIIGSDEAAVPWVTRAPHKNIYHNYTVVN